MPELSRKICHQVYYFLCGGIFCLVLKLSVIESEENLLIEYYSYFLIAQINEKKSNFNVYTRDGDNIRSDDDHNH